ncbi:MAG: hypothetical protein P8181_07970 [bacterium]
MKDPRWPAFFDLLDIHPNSAFADLSSHAMIVFATATPVFLSFDADGQPGECHVESEEDVGSMGRAAPARAFAQQYRSAGGSVFHLD